MAWLIVGKNKEALKIIKKELFEEKAFGEYKSHFEYLFSFEMKPEGLYMKLKASGPALMMIRRIMPDSMVSAYLKSVLQKKIPVCDFEIKQVK